MMDIAIEKCAVRGIAMPANSDTWDETWCGMILVMGSLRATTEPKKVTCPVCLEAIRLAIVVE